MSKQTKQVLFDEIGNETQYEGITKEKVRNAFTSLNDEKIEIDGSNLTNQDIQALQGVLGINQSGSSRFIHIGPVTVSGLTVTVGVTGRPNQWLINNVNYQTSAAVSLIVDPIVNPVNLRMDSVYANSNNTFQILKGTEGPTAVRPVNTDGSLLFLTDILITVDGIRVDQQIDLSGYKEKVEESWKLCPLGTANSFVIDYSDKRTRFKVTSMNDVPKVLQHIIFASQTTRAVEFLVYNAMNLNINIPASATNGLSKGFAVQGTFSIYPKTIGILKYNPDTDFVEPLKIASPATASIYTDESLEGTGSEENPLKVSDDYYTSTEVDSLTEKRLVEVIPVTDRRSLPSNAEIGQVVKDLSTGIRYIYSENVDGAGTTDWDVFTEAGTSIPQSDIDNWNTSLYHKGALVSNVNIADNTRSSGYYSVEIANGTGNTNFPSNNYGNLLRVKSSTFTTDIIADVVGGVYFKTFYHPTENGTAKQWARVWTDQNFNPDNYATSAALATKINKPTSQVTTSDTTYNRFAMLDNSGNSKYFSTNGTGERLLSFNSSGQPVATVFMEEGFETDSQLVSAVLGATYTNNIATIAVSGKTLKKGKMIVDQTNGVLYIAFLDNVIIKK